MVVSNRHALLPLLAALGCVPDDWTFAPALDAGTDALVADVVASDAPSVDAPARADVATDSGGQGGACDGGGVRCGDACGVGPVNLYRGDRDAEDSVGGSHGSLMNGVSFANGRFGDAFVIDGARQYVAIPPAVGNFGTGDFTISLWFNSTHGGVMLTMRAACWSSPPMTGQDFDLTIDGHVAVELFTSVNFYTFISPPGFTDGAWHFTALVRRGDTVTLNVDGADVASRMVEGSFDDPSNTPSYIGTGRCVPGAPGSNGTFDGRPWFIGRIDEVAYYPRALSSEELTATARGLCEP